MLSAVYDAEIVMLVFSGLIFIIPTPPFQTAITRHPLPYFQRNVSMVIIFANCVFVASAVMVDLFGIRDIDDDEAGVYTFAAVIAGVITVIVIVLCIAYRMYQSCMTVCCRRCTRSDAACGAMCRQLVGAGKPQSSFEEQAFAPLIAFVLTGLLTSMLPDMPVAASV